MDPPSRMHSHLPGTQCNMMTTMYSMLPTPHPHSKDGPTSQIVPQNNQKLPTALFASLQLLSDLHM